MNSQVARRVRRIGRWVNSAQQQRWLAAVLLDLEPRLRAVNGYKHLPQLRRALQKELGLNNQKIAA